ncbi:type II toxin-antitoxin system HicA family toxin [Dolichospermum flos-aquae]|nr:type II toxin-antitoxin system HicA family toxin [Dolichospermum flos-aquae]
MNAEKIRQLKTMLSKAGFVYRPAKGSHSFWTHPLMPDKPITIAGNDGDDALKYIEKQVNHLLQKLEKLKEEE